MQGVINTKTACQLERALRRPQRGSHKDPDHQRWVAVVLAAGKGTRMKSQVPKVLHHVCGRPMLQHVLSAIREAGISRIVVVAPPDADAVRACAGDDVMIAVQQEPNGTGHAVLAALPALNGSKKKAGSGPEHVMVLGGDAPLLQSQTVRALMDRHLSTNADVTLLSAVGLSTNGLGRIVRDNGESVAAIVEEKEATPGQLHIKETNSGIYCFRGDALWPGLLEVKPSPSGEVYLTDVIQLTVRAGGKVDAVAAEDAWDTYGVNTRQQLAQATAVMRRRLCDYWMEHGVTIEDPATTYLDSTVSLGEDTILHPGTHLRGATSVGRDCELGPGAVIADSAIGDECRVMTSVLESARLEGQITIGPYCHLRPGSHLQRNVHLGDHVEVKNSTLGSGTKAGHFCYLGDATIGKNVNIGAGTITCNYDGEKKHRTVIEDDVLIGSDTMLVAPVRIGARSKTGAGAVVTHDVPSDTVVVGVPARTLRQTAARRTRKP